MARIVDKSLEMKEFMTLFEKPENAFLKYTRCNPYTPERNVLSGFLMTKRSEGCTIPTLRSYFNTLRSFLLVFRDKSIDEIDATDIRAFLTNYQEQHMCCNATIDNMRRGLSSFYNYLFAEEYVTHNPMLKIHRIKTDTVVRLPFSDEELERIRDACWNIRELALIDFLYSTGVRVSECANCDITDVNLSNREVLIYGKGQKERVVYLDTRAKLHLEKYLSYRKDPDPALFVKPAVPHDRLTKGMIEYTVRSIGDRAGVPDCYPHRFRRTLATKLLEKGMPVEQVQTILGHAKLDTTMIYAKINAMNVKLNHQKYI